MQSKPVIRWVRLVGMVACGVVSTVAADQPGWIVIESSGAVQKVSGLEQGLSAAKVSPTVMEITATDPQQGEWRLTADTPEAHGTLVAVLVSGAVWVGSPAGITGDDLAWSGRWTGPAKVPLADVRGIVRIGASTGGAEAADGVRAIRYDMFRRTIGAIQSGPRPLSDTVLTIDGQVLTGAVSEVTTAGVVLEASGQKNQTPWTQIRQIAFAAAASSTAPAGTSKAAADWLIETSDGSALACALPGLATAATGAPVLTFPTLTGSRLEIPATDCLRLTRVGGPAWIDHSATIGFDVQEVRAAALPGGVAARPHMVRTTAGVPAMRLPTGAGLTIAATAAGELSALVKLSGELRAGEVIGLVVRSGNVVGPGEQLITIDGRDIASNTGRQFHVLLPASKGDGACLTIQAVPVSGLCLGAAIDLVAPVVRHGP